MAITPWRICVDTGGTFTDAVGVDPSGRTRHAKVLSSGALRAGVAGRPSATEVLLTQRWGAAAGVIEGMVCRGTNEDAGAGVRITAFDPARSLIRLERATAWEVGAGVEVAIGEEAPVLAARLLTGTPPAAPLPPMEMRLATTRGTNALLTRRGGRVAFFVTRGFRDLLEIGTQQRPDLFALDVVKPRVLYERAIEVDERISAAGEVLRALDLNALRERARAALAEGIDCAGVALLHADRFPEHERQVAEVLREVGFAHAACSHEAPMIKVLPRAQTCVVDAYLAPVVGEYLAKVAAAMGGASDPSRRLLVLTSAGALVSAREFRARDSLLSGPAGGVIGARLAARRSGIARAISFDMGGTSTDVARLDERDSLVFEHSVGDARLVAPAVGVETVAAGGGSICGFDGARLLVGPGSAGASPGPACYGAGGPLTLTDVNLLLGRLDGARFPIPIDPGGAERALDGVLANMRAALGTAPAREKLLEGFLRIAAETDGGRRAAGVGAPGVRPARLCAGGVRRRGRAARVRRGGTSGDQDRARAARSGRAQRGGPASRGRGADGRAATAPASRGDGRGADGGAARVVGAGIGGGAAGRGRYRRENDDGRATDRRAAPGGAGIDAGDRV